MTVDLPKDERNQFLIPFPEVIIPYCLHSTNIPSLCPFSGSLIQLLEETSIVISTKLKEQVMEGNNDRDIPTIPPFMCRSI